MTFGPKQSLQDDETQTDDQESLDRNTIVIIWHSKPMPRQQVFYELQDYLDSLLLGML